VAEGSGTVGPGAGADAGKRWTLAEKRSAGDGSTTLISGQTARGSADEASKTDKISYDYGLKVVSAVTAA
jgi:hypothetical protein